MMEDLKMSSLLKIVSNLKKKCAQFSWALHNFSWFQFKLFTNFK